jgi:hypothetical protein
MLVSGWFAYGFVFDRAPPHRFEVTLGEPANAVFLILGNSEGDVSTMMEGGPTDFSGSRFIADASGVIRIMWPDGSNTECMVSYITNGETEPHSVVVKDRLCPEIGSHVQY